jgi:DtxR family Mn-dependent transcriptional regulator
MASESVEEYIEAIYRIGGSNGTVSTCVLAGLLGVAPPSVTTMLGRLSRDGLVKHIRYHGITLTQRGHELAAAMIRRHRLSERLLTDVFGMSWDKVHDAACKFEHVLIGEIEERAYQVLGRPKRCPHGNLLEGDEDCALILLHDAPLGELVEVIKLADESGKFLHSAGSIGLVPSTEVVVISVSNDDIHLNIAGRQHCINRELAGRIWVQPTMHSQVNP